MEARERLRRTVDVDIGRADSTRQSKRVERSANSAGVCCNWVAGLHNKRLVTLGPWRAER
jgi:hypothetical protein